MKKLPVAPIAPPARRHLPLAPEVRDLDRQARPILAVWELTLACDLACGHCGSRAGKARPDELTTVEALALVDQLAELGVAFGASVGATRVITDRGWVGHGRQIGTTGVIVEPQLYLAFGISGAVQHTSGLGAPAHVISVNTDAHCPMMQLADLAVVADANEVLDALLVRLGALEAAHG